MDVVIKRDWGDTLPAEKVRRAAEKAATALHSEGFVQVYEKGWRRIRHLIETNPSLAKIYVFLAQHIDGTCGAVVVAQDVIAQELGMSRRTVIRQTQALERLGALVRIRLNGSVYAYALDPEEVWRSWEAAKDLAAFRTKTLVRKADQAHALVRRRLMVMLDQPELPLHPPAAS